MEDVYIVDDMLQELIAKVCAEEDDKARQAAMDPTGDQEYIVEKILDKKIDSKGVAKYLVKWEGFPSSNNTWEPLEHLVECEAAIQKYELSQAVNLAERHGNSPNKNTLKERQEYEVDQILGLTMVNKEKFFLISLVDCSQTTFIRASLANKMFPSKVIDFYLSHIEWKTK